MEKNEIFFHVALFPPVIFDLLTVFLTPPKVENYGKCIHNHTTVYGQPGVRSEKERSTYNSPLLCQI